MPRSRRMMVAVFSLLVLTLAGAPAWSQDSGQPPAGVYGGQMPPGGPMGPGMGGRPPFGPPPALGGRYQVVSGSFTVWHGGKPTPSSAMLRVDTNTGETWILQETSDHGRLHREWVRIGEAR